MTGALRCAHCGGGMSSEPPPRMFESKGASPFCHGSLAIDEGNGRATPVLMMTCSQCCEDSHKHRTAIILETGPTCEDSDYTHYQGYFVFDFRAKRGAPNHKQVRVPAAMDSEPEGVEHEVLGQPGERRPVR